MKVIHLISGGDTGGARTHIYSLLSCLCRRGVGVQLVCFVGGPFAEGAEALGIPTTVLKKGFFGSIRPLLRMIRSGEYDVVHCHGAKANLMGMLLKPRLRIPVITTVHSDYRLDYLHRPFAAATFGMANRLALRRLDYRVCVSETLRARLINRGFKPNDLYTIYNGLDFSHTVAKTDRAAYFSQYNFKVTDGDVIVGIAARLDPVKDIPTLLRALKLARETCPQLKLAIAGEGQQRKELESLTDELGLRESVCFLGWVSELDAFYGALDINALSSLSEGFPYALPEGARAHLATVATNVGGVPAIIENNVTGILIEPGDTEGLAAAMVRYASDPDYRKAMGDALYQKGRDDFSEEATGDRQMEIYDQVFRAEEHRKGKKDGVVICGAYGFGNAGDEAILDAIIHEMRTLDPALPITVFSRRPKETRARCGVNTYHTFHIPSLHRALRGAKLYINGGGNLMQDVTSRYSLWYYLYTLKAAHKRGCGVQMYGCGIGPLLYQGDRDLTGSVINENVDVITLREPDSLKVLEAIGVTKPQILLASDPALTLPGAPEKQVTRLLESHDIDPNGKYLAFVLRRWKGFEEKSTIFAAAAVYAYLNYELTPVFLCINHRTDHEAAAMVAKHLSIPYHVISEPMSSAMIIGLLAKMKAVVSMRLHGLVFAAGQGVPLAGVSYDPKVTAFLDYIEQDNYIDFDELSVTRMTGLIDSAIQLSDQRQELRRRTELLNEKEENNRRAAAQLLKREA